VFTPRIGKPVEINALWLNALDVAVRLALPDAMCARNASASLCSRTPARASRAFE